jgi:hypothetical protein
MLGTPTSLAPPVRPSIRRAGAAELARLHRPRRGSVHAVFARTIGIAWDDGALTTLQGPGPLLAPFALGLTAQPGGLRPGDPARRGDGRIELGGHRIEPSGATAVDTAVPRLRLGPAALLRVLPGPAGAPALASDPGRRGLALLAAALTRRRAAALVEAAGTLMGLGEGLTPAGDDVLVGALAAVHAAEPRWAAGWPAREPATVAAFDRLAATRTTTVAAAFLREAWRGQVSEPLQGVLGAADPEAARAAALALARLGATSGRDTLRGIALALEALDR